MSISGYYGNHCELESHICDSKPCYNGSQCVKGAGGPMDYTCTCRTCKLFLVEICGDKIAALW